MVNSNRNMAAQSVPVLDERTAQLLKVLHRGGAHAYWWAVKGERKQTIWWKPGRPAALLNSQHNMYFGVHPVTTIPTTTKEGKPVEPQYVRGRREDIAAINCLFAEFDAKDFGGGKEEALLYIDALLPAASVIVDSGGGYHCYWLLDTPFVIATDDDYRRADRAQKGWVTRIESDDGAKDLARVLRVPGTRNFKPAYGPDYPVVHFIKADFGQCYSLEELEETLPPVPAPRSTRAPSHSAPGEAPEVQVPSNADLATIAEAALLLSRLSDARRDTYASWVEVGMAVRELGHIGFYLWKTFSEKSPKYRVGDCEAKWPTFHVGTPGDDLTLNSLRRWVYEDDPDCRHATDTISRAEYDHLKAERDDLKKQFVIQQKIMYRTDLKPQEKGVLVGLAPIVEAARHLGGNQDRVPLSYDHAADVLKTSKSTIGRAVEVGETLGLWRRDPEPSEGTDGMEIKRMRLELQGWDTIEQLPEVARAKHGGLRPGAGRKPRCPECPAGTPAIQRTITKEQLICQGCGSIFHETPEHCRDIVLVDGNQDDTGEGIAVGNQDDTGDPQPEVVVASFQDDTGTLPSEPGNQDDTGDVAADVEFGARDTTISLAPNFFESAPTYARRVDELKVTVNPDQVKFVLRVLPDRGPTWARGHMDRVEGWEHWPMRVRQAVVQAEGRGDEPRGNGASGTAARR